MKLQRKITVKGKLVSRGMLSSMLVNATDKELCYWWQRCCGRPITEFAKS